MKKCIQFIIIVFILTAAIGCSLSAKDNNTKSIHNNTTSVVYVCDGKYATKYHKHSNCRGLNNCKGGMLEMSVSEAKNYDRSSCSICYK